MVIRWVWVLLHRQAALDGIPAINASRVYRNMRQNALLLKRKSVVPSSKRTHTGKVAVKKAISGGTLTRSSSVVIMNKNC